MTLILCGMKHAGKTTVGKALSDYLSCRFTDTDKVLMNCFKKDSIGDVFDFLGELRFRRAETKILNMMQENISGVLALGGGTLDSDENANLIKKMGRLIYLYLDFETAYQRLVENPLPRYMKALPTVAEYRYSYDKRDAQFKRFAHFVINVSTFTTGDIISQLNQEVFQHGEQ